MTFMKFGESANYKSGQVVANIVYFLVVIGL